MELQLYTRLASWWPLVSDPAESWREADVYRSVLEVACDPATALELGSGGGNVASHLKSRFAMTLADVSPAMLEVSRALNPECEHVRGDMRSMRLEREFDAVLVHDAVMYMTSARDLLRALETAYVHCRPGGAALIVPDCVRESFAERTSTGGGDGEDRSLRYIEWAHDPDPADETFVVDMALLLRTVDGRVRTVSERHVMGLFERERWLGFCRETGFRSEIVALRHPGADGQGNEMFLCRKP